MNPDSPLADKRVRNSFVHVDERLDQFLRLHSGKRVGPFAILHWEGAAPTSEQSDVLRIIDTQGLVPGDWRVMVRGEALHLRPLLLEMDRIGRAFPLPFILTDGRSGVVALGPARSG